jgi:hypothetical protein
VHTIKKIILTLILGLLCMGAEAITEAQLIELLNKDGAPKQVAEQYIVPNATNPISPQAAKAIVRTFQTTGRQFAIVRAILIPYFPELAPGYALPPAAVAPLLAAPVVAPVDATTFQQEQAIKIQAVTRGFLARRRLARERNARDDDLPPPPPPPPPLSPGVPLTAKEQATLDAMDFPLPPPPLLASEADKRAVALRSRSPSPRGGARARSRSPEEAPRPFLRGRSRSPAHAMASARARSNSPSIVRQDIIRQLRAAGVPDHDISGKLEVMGFDPLPSVTHRRPSAFSVAQLRSLEARGRSPVQGHGTVSSKKLLSAAWKDGHVPERHLKTGSYSLTVAQKRKLLNAKARAAKGNIRPSDFDTGNPSVRDIIDQLGLEGVSREDIVAHLIVQGFDPKKR